VVPVFRRPGRVLGRPRVSGTHLIKPFCCAINATAYSMTTLSIMPLIARKNYPQHKHLSVSISLTVTIRIACDKKHKNHLIWLPSFEIIYGIFRFTRLSSCHQFVLGNPFQRNLCGSLRLLKVSSLG